MTSRDHSVITFATNRMTYVEFAMNCAQSILLHNELRVYIVTDQDYSVPAKYKDRVFIIPAKPEHLPLGIAIKLHTDEYLQTEHTLFIDSDCICYGDLAPIFEAANGNDISVAGNIVPTADWCGPTQAKTIKQEFGIDQIIRFNGGLYYFRKSALTKKIFDQARKIAEKYDEYGFDRIKNKWINEEGPLSIAMMMNGQKPIADDGRFITDLYTDHRPATINVLSGSRILRNQSEGNKKHRAWYPSQYSPLLLHFGGNNINSYPYNSQSRLLKLKRMGLSKLISSAWVSIFTHLPYRSFHWLRSLGRTE